MLRSKRTNVEVGGAGGGVRAGQFEDHATEVIGHLRTALAAVLSRTSVVGVRKGVGDIRKPTDLQKMLDLDAALAWSIYRAAHAEDPFRAATFIPGSVAFTRFLRTAERFGVDKETTDRAANAFTAFEGMVEIQGGDRASFLSMASDFDAELSSSVDLKHRRAAFRANSHIHGIQASTIVSCTAVRPNGEGTLDSASIRGHLGVRQLRRNPVLMTEFKWAMTGTDNSPERRTQFASEPLDPPAPGEDGPTAQLQHMGLMRRYCSQPLPNFRTFEENGYLQAELLTPGLGNAAAIDFFVGQVVRAFFPTPLSGSGPSWFTTIITRPASLFFRDLLIHRDAWDGPPPQVECFAGQSGEGFIFRGSARISGPNGVTELGKGPEVLHTSEIPRYVDMVGESLERLGWNPDEFRVFRFRWEYPVLQSLVRVAF